jgi:hypothetical protein
LIFTNAVKRMGVRDSGRSRVPPGDGDRFAAKRLHPKIAN